MKWTSKFATWVTTLGLLLSGAHAGTILQNRFDAATSLYDLTVAQSFTAIDARTKIGFGLADANNFLGSLQFTATLFAGSGVSGPTLGSTTITLTSLRPVEDWTPVFCDFDFGNVSLHPGQIYTAQISSPSGRGMVFLAERLGNTYPGGGIYYNTDPGPVTTDAVFRVVSVPEPTCLALLVLGVGLKSLAHRMSRSVAVPARCEVI